MKLKLGILCAAPGFACAGVGFNFFYDSGHGVTLSSESGMVGGVMYDNAGGKIVHVPGRMRRTIPVDPKKL